MGRPGIVPKPAVIIINGEACPIGDLVQATGLPYGVLYGRLITNGWCLERALSVPVRKVPRRSYSYDPRNNPLVKRGSRAI